MKNIISLLVLICSVAVIIVSCKKDEESTTTSTDNTTGTTSSSFTCTAVASCSATASGSFYVDNGTLSGIYDLYHIYAHLFTGFDNSTGCVSNSNFTSGRGPTGTQSLIIQNVFTSSTSFATKSVFYSDTACSSEISSMVTGSMKCQ